MPHRPLNRLDLRSQMPNTFGAFHITAFRLIWPSNFFSYVARWMQVTFISWFVLELTDSPFNVALVGFFHMAPLLICGVLGGVLADKLNKRKILIATQASNLFFSIGFLILLVTNNATIWHGYLVVCTIGFGWALDMPSRRSIIFDVTGEKGLTNALALDSIGMHGSRMLGPTIAGALISVIGISAGYGIASLFYAISMFLIILVRVPSPQTLVSTATNILSNIAQGFQYALSNRIILSVIVITVIMNLMCFSYLQMVPVIARDKLGVGPGLMGLLMGGDGLGSIVGATAIASASSLRRLGRVFLIGSTLGFIMTFCCSLTTSFALAYPFLLLLGICVAGFGTLQSIIVISSSSPDMRGRALGIVTLAIGFGPLGALAIGVLATATTPSNAIMIFSIIGITLVLIVTAFSSGLRSQTTALS